MRHVWGEEKCIENFGEETGNKHLKNPSVYIVPTRILHTSAWKALIGFI
jgi:hypothetical protein